MSRVINLTDGQSALVRLQEMREHGGTAQTTGLKDEVILSFLEERLLLSPESPIVLLRRRPRREIRIADAVAPRNPYLGVLLPYTPLHRILMKELGFPVVATSGNLSEEPIATSNDEALDRLGEIADLFERGF